MQSLYRAPWGDPSAADASAALRRMTLPPHRVPDAEDPSHQTAEVADQPVSVLTFNAVDPSGASGLGADVQAIGSVGCHPLPVVTGAYTRDSAEIHGFAAFDDESVSEQARAVLEDIPVGVIKVGFAGCPAILGQIAELSSDYPDVPLIAYMPDLSWWDETHIDSYQEAFTDLLLPQASLLVGNHSTLRRWLLPDWESDQNPGPRDIARAASEHGTPYVLVTGQTPATGSIENTLATPQSVLFTRKFERFEARFVGAGETLSAALAALLATGSDLNTAVAEALEYLDEALNAGFRPGMGRFVPDRLFWAQGDGTDPSDPEGTDPSSPQPGDIFDDPFNETRH